MDKKNYGYFQLFYNITYTDDYKHRHLAYNINSSDLKNLKDRYGNIEIVSVTKKAYA